MPRQNPSAVVMVRPLKFASNPETAADNYFQTADAPGDEARALAEVDVAISGLKARGVVVHYFDETRADVPDAVFPNNWFSTHGDGTLVTYPMKAISRRRERRADILDAITDKYNVQRSIDLASYEGDGRYLEGTGAIVFDHDQKIAFMARSERADEGLLSELCAELAYEPFVFDALDRDHQPIYHTNVMLSVGERVALVGLGCLPSTSAQTALMDQLTATGRAVVELSLDQISAFSGNALELPGADGSILALSARALAALTPAQRAIIEERCAIFAPDLSTVEKSGGSMRCMLAGIHLPPK